jgi:hypothetical protein
MIKIDYDIPNEIESPDDIAIYNLKISDKYKNIQTFCQSSIAWLKNDINRNYQSLELLLREQKLDTHLIAKPNDSSIKLENIVYTTPNSDIQHTNIEYVLLISCKSKEEAITEILKYHLSYEDNFECLLKTGFITSVNNDTNKLLEDANENKILNNKLKYNFTLIDNKTSINVIIEDIIKNYKTEPEKLICGKLGEKDIYALTINNEIISPIGWIEHDEDYELIDFRKIKKM